MIWLNPSYISTFWFQIQLLVTLYTQCNWNHCWMTTTSNIRMVFPGLHQSWLVISDILVNRLNMGIRKNPLNVPRIKVFELFWYIYIYIYATVVHVYTRCLWILRYILNKRKLLNYMRTACLFMWVRWWYFRNKHYGCIAIQWNSFADDIWTFIRLILVCNFTLSLRMSAYKFPTPVATALHGGILHRIGLV